MWSLGFVLDAPGFDGGPCLLQGPKPVLGQAFLAKMAIERLDERVVRGFAGPTELEPDPAAISPAQASMALEMNSGPSSTEIACGRP
jgi:hypothetical protein